jgi:hypothetical protein
VFVLLGPSVGGAVVEQVAQCEIGTACNQVFYERAVALRGGDMYCGGTLSVPAEPAGGVDIRAVV